MGLTIRRWFGPVLGIVAAGLLVPGGMLAQDVEEHFPGVSLGLLYEGRTQPTLAVQPFIGRVGGGAAASRAENIVARDLRYSNRFQVVDSIPAAFVQEGGVDYALWDELGATWLVTGRVEGAGTGSVLILDVHDVIYREVREQGRFPLPDPSSPDFRMAVHIASDAVVQWITGEPGIAASRILFVRRMDDGSQDLWVVDSDGENLRRVTRERADEGGYPIALSPAWSPDGARVAYGSYRTGVPRLYELNLQTGQTRTIPAPRSGVYMTPSYHPDGERIFFGVTGTEGAGLYSYNLARDCCFEQVTEGRWDDMSPSFAPDGNRFVFNSNRLGVSVPQIYLMTSGASRPTVLSPYEFNRPGHFNAPDWSPRGERIAYHGRIDRGITHHILVSEIGQRRRIVRLTSDGNNQDPSWAPDGRHLVYMGERAWGRGLFIVDVESGNTRTLVSGMHARFPAWSPSLGGRLAEDR